MAKWEVIRKSRMSGSYEYDNTANCLPPGMPGMMAMAYGMEVMQSKDRITFFSELNDALRRVYLDGRKPTPAILDDPTYAGYSTGRWEGDTLVVETVALNDATFIEGFSPAQRGDDDHRADPAGGADAARGSDHRARPQGAARALEHHPALPQGLAAQRSAARVRVR